MQPNRSGQGKRPTGTHSTLELLLIELLDARDRELNEHLLAKPGEAQRAREQSGGRLVVSGCGRAARFLTRVLSDDRQDDARDQDRHHHEHREPSVLAQERIDPVLVASHSRPRLTAELRLLELWPRGASASAVVGGWSQRRLW
jgi:hypothetical protein